MFTSPRAMDRDLTKPTSSAAPPPSMTDHRPSYSPQPLEPVFAVAFDQRIDAAAVLDTIEVTADNRALQVRLATEEELAADNEAQRAAARAGEGRWLAFVAAEPLPADAAISVAIGPGTPSAEGPLVTAEAQHFSFRTYAPLRIERHGCSWIPSSAWRCDMTMCTSAERSRCHLLCKGST